LCALSLAEEEAAEAEENEFRLAANDVPQELCGFVTIDFTEGFTG
jgi:hypothetical protein